MKALIAASMMAGLAFAMAAPASGALKVGDAAPDFTLPATGGGEATLSKVLEEHNVVLAFFPKAFTPG